MDHQLYLLRHGETEWSRTGKHTGHTDIALTATGEEQARAIGPMLTNLLAHQKPALILVSPRRRAQHTAELAGLSSFDSTTQLTEWDYGDYEGLTTEEIRKTVPGWTVWSHPTPGGETPEQVTSRADAVLLRAKKALEFGNVVFVGHGHFSRVLIARWLELPASSGVHFGLEPASISALGYERESPQITYLNIPPGC